MFKTSNLLFFVTIILFLLSFLTYKLLKENLYDNHKYEQEILFNNIHRETSSLLNKLLFKYYQEKDILLDKHKQVLKYLETNSYDNSLNQIHEIINKDSKDNPYNIYITDENLIIKNTTFKPDLNFDLNFAKDLFEYHKKENMIGVSAPIFETFSMNFLSYTDSFLPIGNNRILQVSYKYNNVYSELENIQRIIDLDDNISNSTAYIIFDDGYIGDFIFKSFKSYKPTLEEITKRINNGKELLSKLNDTNIISTQDYIENGTKYKLYYFLGKSPLYDEAKIIYSVIFDETEFENKLLNLNIITIILMLLLIMTIYIIYKIKTKESLLNYKDKFIEHAVHEIKTPLSVIKLNNQLREKKFGEDKYSQKIEAAVRTLQVSYDDMIFLHSKNKIEYEIKKLNIQSHIEDRINFFNSVASSQSRTIVLKISNPCFVNISKIELNRLIDNNLSNAIKYSNISTNIEVILEKNSLKFITLGNKITNTKNIFEKYNRENTTQGGHGLGLSIVKNICKKYNISIKVKSMNGINIFSYKFNQYDYKKEEI